MTMRLLREQLRAERDVQAVRSDDETSRISEPARDTTSELQDHLGNRWLLGALNGSEGAFGDYVTAGLVLATEGVEPGLFGSNSAMLAVMRAAQASAASDAGAPTNLLPEGLQATSGTPLPEPIARRMSAVLGHRLDHVRVHTDATSGHAAQALEAYAFTLGSHVFFAPGRFQPGSAAGDALLLHELTHVVQHDEGRITTEGVSRPADPLEREAYTTQAAAADALSQVDALIEAETAPGAREGLPGGGSPSFGEMALPWSPAVPSLNLSLNLDPSSEANGRAVIDSLSAAPPSTHKVAVGEQAGVVGDLGEEISEGWCARISPASIEAVSAMAATPTDQEAAEPAAVGPAPTVDETPSTDGASLIETAATDARAQMAEQYAQQADLPVTETAEEETTAGEAASEASEAQASIAALPTDSGLEVAPPLVPELDLAEDATAQNEALEEINTDIEAEVAAASVDIGGDHGEAGVAPTEGLEEETLAPVSPSGESPEDPVAAWQEAVSEADLGSGQYPFSIDVDVVADVLAEPNADLQERWEEDCAEQATHREALELDAEGEVEGTVVEARRQEAEAHAELEGRVSEARSAWEAENQENLEKTRSQAGQASAEATGQLAEGEAAFERDANAAIDQAVAEAETERSTAEARAGEEKRRAEEAGEEGGFWSWVGEVLDAVLEAIQAILTAIFDALQWIVDAIFTALELVLDGLMAVVQALATAILRLLRWTLQQVRETLVGWLGETAERWLEAIDGLLTAGIDTLNAIFGWIRSAITGILEMLNQGLQDILTLYQWGLYALILLVTGLWLRYVWIAIENADKIVANVTASFEGLYDELLRRFGPEWETFLEGFLSPGNIALMTITLVAFVASQFMVVGEVLDIIGIILLVLFAAGVAVHLGESLLTYVDCIMTDDVDGARTELANTIWYVVFTAGSFLALLGLFKGLKVVMEKVPGGGADPGIVREEMTEAVGDPDVVTEEVPEAVDDPNVVTEEVPEVAADPAVVTEEVPEIVGDPEGVTEEVPEAVDDPAVVEEEERASSTKALSAEETKAFVRAVGQDGLNTLLAKYGVDALRYYGPEFFESYKGATSETIQHLLQNDGIVKGQIKGCHDADMFVDELVTQGRGQILKTEVHPADARVVRYEYKLFKRDKPGNVTQPPSLVAGDPQVKTVLKDLGIDSRSWQDLANEAVDSAIKKMVLRPTGGSFRELVPGGLEIEGWVRDGKVDTFYPKW